MILQDTAESFPVFYLNVGPYCRFKARVNTRKPVRIGALLKPNNKGQLILARSYSEGKFVAVENESDRSVIVNYL